jgi:outer membrane usher protein
MTSLRIGDSIMRGGVGGGPLRFGGIQWARDFSVAPTFITIPLPTLTGSAAIPSVVDVLVNNRLQAQRDVQPGPFEFTNLPVLTGAGEVQLVVRDALGRESVTTQRYYAASHMLRRGLHDFSYELGFLRDDYGFRSNDYGALAGAATHRYGLTDTLTGEVHIEATEKTQVAGAAASLALPGLGLIDGAAAMSRSRDRIGALFGLGFERRSIGLSFGARVEIASEGYRNLGLPDFRQAPRKTARAFVGLPLAFGSVGLSYLLRDERDDRPDTEVLGASASARLGSFGSLHLSAQRFFGEENETVLGLVLSTPLGPRTSAGASMEMRDGGVQASAAIQRSPPVGEGWGYHASVSHGAFDRASGRLGYQGGFGAYEAELTWTERGSGVRASVSGAVGFVAGGGGFTSRQLTQSFATVKVGNVKGVEVYADNQLVARTNGSGFAVVPRLRPYESNVLRIEATDLPWDATVTGGEMEVRPRARSGVALDFGVQQSHVALVRMVREDGAAVPAGAMVQIEGNPEEFVAAPGGEAYLTGLEPKNRVRASWTGGTCAFDLPFEASDDPQPRLGPFTCR